MLLLLQKSQQPCPYAVILMIVHEAPALMKSPNDPQITHDDAL